MIKTTKKSRVGTITHDVEEGDVFEVRDLETLDDGHYLVTERFVTTASDKVTAYITPLEDGQTRVERVDSNRVFLATFKRKPPDINDHNRAIVLGPVRIVARMWQVWQMVETVP